MGTDRGAFKRNQVAVKDAERAVAALMETAGNYSPTRDCSFGVSSCLKHSPQLNF